MRLLYLVHDLGDAAVRRRQRFLEQGGAHVSLIGFRRQTASARGSDLDGLAIGQTQDGRLLRRILSTARAVGASRRWRAQVVQADVIVARSLEMLLIAVLVRRRAGVTISIVYECLDIHRLMTRRDPIGIALRFLEQRLLDSCALLVVSSPRFIEAYFAPRHRRLPRWVLLENKLLLSELDDSRTPDLQGPSPVAGPPWRIGWFGIIRCRRSLELLASLVRASAGAIEVEIRGRPARDVLPEFDAVVASTPGLSFFGPYDRATDLAMIYGRVHFSWAIDYYEQGLNSAWLLPNRLYEGSMFGTVPLALRDVETGRWLARHGCGLLLDPPLEHTLPTAFASMTPPAYRNARQRVAALDPAALMETPATAAAFVATLAQLRASRPAIVSTFAPATMT